MASQSASVSEARAPPRSGRHGRARERRDPRRPRRVHAVAERQRARRLDAGERQLRDVLGLRGEQLRPERRELGLGGVERGGRARRRTPRGGSARSSRPPWRGRRRAPRTPRPSPRPSTRGAPRSAPGVEPVGVGAAWSKNASTLRLIDARLAAAVGRPSPWTAMTSSMACVVASSSAESAGTMPSPLSFVAAKIFSVSETSAERDLRRVGLAEVLRMSCAPARTSFPARSASAIDASGTSSDGLNRSPRSRGPPSSHAMAARTSGGRMRPSSSVSSSASVRASNSRPVDRAGEGDPELLVERVQVDRVGRRGEDDLVDPAGAKELPAVRGPGHPGARA